jgi:regulator of protease activity HflC (stomatin/prohibitin superfamily)
MSPNLSATPISPPSHRLPPQKFEEHRLSAANGLAMLFTLLVALIVEIVLFIAGARGGLPLLFVPALLAVPVTVVLLIGLFSVAPNQARVLTIFGRYVGTVHETGLRWANPFMQKRPVSLRVRNFESEKLKVNDKDGNPVDIAAVVVWKVVDTAEALFHVDNYENFVKVQSESALRHMASYYAYDAHQEGEVALRSHTGEIAEKLKNEIQDRLAQAGVEVIEARITHLAYAQEIAHAMLQRQQASAVIAARSKIVDGAVGMVEMALAQLEAKKIVELDGERRAAMVSNLLVVLCSEHSSSPVLNVGTLYS